MAVRKRRRRYARQPSKPASSQNSIFQLIMAVLALFMVLSFGDQFASSAAGCYGAISQPPEESGSQKSNTFEKKNQKQGFKVNTGGQ